MRQWTCRSQGYGLRGVGSPQVVWVRAGVERRGHAEPREALTMKGEIEAGNECVQRERNWRYNCWQGVNSVREESHHSPTRAVLQSLFSSLWPEAEGSIDQSHPLTSLTQHNLSLVVWPRSVSSIL